MHIFPVEGNPVRNKVTRLVLVKKKKKSRTEEKSQLTLESSSSKLSRGNV
jgi:hypothetical protein